MLRGPRFHRGLEGAQGLHVFVVGGGVALRQLADGNAFGGRGGINFIVHIREVPGVADDRVMTAERAKEQVKDHGGPAVTDVNAVVHRGAADVEGHRLRILRPKGAQDALLGVEKGKGHRGLGVPRR